jgi:hypothetical protein
MNRSSFGNLGWRLFSEIFLANENLSKADEQLSGIHRS